MKRLVIAGVVLALLAAPAVAQMGGGRHKAGGEKADSKAAKVDEKAYQEALKRIPEPSGPVDPWGPMRPADPPKAKAK